MHLPALEEVAGLMRIQLAGLREIRDRAPVVAPRGKGCAATAECAASAALLRSVPGAVVRSASLSSGWRGSAGLLSAAAVEEINAGSASLRRSNTGPPLYVK